MSLVDTFSNTKQNISNTLNKVDISSIKNNIASSTVNATQSVQNFISTYSNSTILFGLIIIVLLALFVSYGLYWLVSEKIFSNTTDIILNTNIPVICNQSNSFKAAITPVGNGLRRAYTFWIYISDMSIYQGMYKHVLHLSSNDNDPITSACPYIFLDKVENKLYVLFSKRNGFTVSNSNLNNLNNNTSATASANANINMAALMAQGILIPYVPLQRWVHIGIVVNQTSSNTTVTCYVDGDISTTKSTGDETEPVFSKIITENSSTATVGTSSSTSSLTVTSANAPLSNYATKNYENLNLDTTGKLIIGGSTSDVINGVGFSGLISKFKSFNYDINQKDIYKDYNEGPINSILVNLGIGNYGIRNPIYRIS